HHYGVGNEAAAWCEPCLVAPGGSRFSELYSEFRLHRHLLEQSSPPAARNPARQWRNAVGEPAPVVLALARSIHDCLDGRESFQVVAGGGVRDSPAAGRDCIFHSDKSADQSSWARLYSSGFHWK